ncbi:copper amine oxidase family protein [Schinkia azotoformans MEV2011]|uniref:Copper amine oxidase family protein n=1 Tax=Schinkia azotoformans MEV2011 TaxID=1348973 RepID=A0A072NSC6_SCHAZ|nr:copper amine oxidase family protein [Schinkia azotoformans MEV2011]
MKRLLILLMSLFLLVPYVSAEQPISVYVDGKQQSYSQSPVIENGSTLVPLRGIFESLGAKVEWNGSTQTVTAVKENTTIVLTIGSKSPTVNGTVKSISTPGKILNGSTMVPLRFVSEALGADVKWDGTARVVTIFSGAVAYDVVLEFPADKYPQTATHIKNAIARGESAICTVDRDGADENRAESLKGIPTKDGYDRDEWPMAMCAEGGEGADIAYVESSDNRGSGSWVGNQLEQYPDGTRVLFKVVGERSANPQPVTPTVPTTPVPSKPAVELTKDDYNCSDFKTQAEAQAVFEESLRVFGKDVYRLDNDGDKRVCESLK